MRLFTALDISADVRATLAELLRQLTPAAPFQWSRAENLHITAKFIGNWPAENYEALRQALAAIAKTGPIEIAVGGLFWFPNPHSSRVLLAGIQAGPALQDLPGSFASTKSPSGRWASAMYREPPNLTGPAASIPFENRTRCPGDAACFSWPGFQTLIPSPAKTVSSGLGFSWPGFQTLIHFTVEFGGGKVGFSWPGFQTLIHSVNGLRIPPGGFSWPGFQTLIHLTALDDGPIDALAGRDSKP